MSPDAVAALLGGLTGAGATLGIGFISRAWASQDARNASRREYVTAVTERLQRIVKVKTVEELAALNHEMFGVNRSVFTSPAAKTTYTSGMPFAT